MLVEIRRAGGEMDRDAAKFHEETLGSSKEVAQFEMHRGE